MYNFISLALQDFVGNWIFKHTCTKSREGGPLLEAHTMGGS